MRDRQVGLGAVLAPQCRNATPPLVTASAAHALRHSWPTRALTYPAIADMPLRQRTPAVCFTTPIQAARARNARVRAAIDRRLYITVEAADSQAAWPWCR
jgi:hypothetical protein